MSVTVYLRGRFGGQLFQYVFARLLADRYQAEFACIDDPQDGIPTLMALASDFKLDIGSSVCLADMQQYFLNLPLSAPGTRYSGTEHILKECTPNEFNNLLNAPPRKLACRGYYQRAQFYSGYRELIKTWLSFIPPPIPYTIGPRDVLVNIRGGFDFDVLGWTVPLSFYEEALRRIDNPGTVYICAAGANAHLDGIAKRWNAVVYHGQPFEHFAFFRHFKRIILGGSSFGWWAAWLSDASAIYSPIPAGTATPSRLHMLEGRFVELEANYIRRPRPVFRRKSEIAAPIEAGSDLAIWILGQERPFGLSDIPETLIMSIGFDPAQVMAALLRTGLVDYVLRDIFDNEVPS